jgi:hypothetical protein
MLKDAHAQLGDWEAAVAAYNQGASEAQKWLRAGKPQFGDPRKDGTDGFTACYNYVGYVRSSMY